MKIKKQISVLIIGIIIIPVLCLIFMPLYMMYLNSSRTKLINGYKELRKLDTLQLTEENWNELKNQIDRIPQGVELIFYYKGTIHLSTIKEIPEGTQIAIREIYDFINETSDTYDYQLKTIFPTERNQTNTRIMRNKGLIFTRVPANTKPQHKLNLFDLFFITVNAIIIFTITIVVYISRSISKSIVFLEDATQKIADGDLETEIESPKKTRNSNEITSLNVNLDKLRLSLKEEEYRRSRFIMGISHDLRTPVALIKGYTEAISDGIVTDMDDIKRSLSIIHSKTEQLENLINDLISYAKLNNSDWQQNLQKTEIKPLITEFMQTAQLTAEICKRNISTYMNVEDGLKIALDKTLFNRVLENIFSNALRYTKENDSIEITAIQNEMSILITISDSGIGIEKQDIDHIYEIFYRGTSSRREQGHGIGLSIVKNIIDAMNWKIDVESEAGKRTAFTITIPLEDDRNQV